MGYTKHEKRKYGIELHVTRRSWDTKNARLQMFCKQTWHTKQT